MEQVQTFFSYHKALMQLVHGASFSGLSQRKKWEALLALCGGLLNTDSVAIWSMSLCGASLNRELYYQPQLGHHYIPYTLERTQHPLYFRALEETEILFTHDVIQDPRTRSLQECYLGTAVVGASILDAPIYDGNRLYGVLCLENNEQRRWSLADIACAAAFADTISLINTHQAWLNSRKELDYITHHDDFTGLQNQRALQHRMQQLMQKPAPHGFALLWFDIDRLNAINNGMGASVGDAVVSEIAARLRGVLLSGKDMVARVGGDEFTLLYCWADDDHKLEATVASIMEAVNQPLYIAQQKLAVTTSVGVAVYPNDAEDITSLLRCSESAMYHAKACGRRQAQFYNQAVSASAKARFLLENQLIDALANEGLSVFYQPIMSADAQTLVSCEALVRWPHPSAGFLSPAEFLPLAYEAGLMAELDCWVLERVCQDIKQARALGLSMPTVAVNLSADTVMDPQLADKVFNLLEQYQIQGHQLELEMIEDAIKGDSNILRQTLDQLVRMGIKLSIDDFGTGYSSLLRLKNLPFTKLKIDRSFIQELPHNPDDCAITLSVLGMARGLGVTVVAEGVENVDQEHWLQQQGCHYLQGFKYHRPMPVAEFFALLTTALAH
ncbi:sensor domain-containing phosphodiesterase [Oceanisphaera sp. IT1-181]|uniref:sensor domain-containing phosphodiesterase n=1 Tax=Oceanisphaera sp. IT1-181 TaxID=3081199 RepID=UPI0029C9CCB4|nr:sensor domain-containing phosphodiesterase [Oceanisphaera sp. IT1-181]